MCHVISDVETAWIEAGMNISDMSGTYESQ